MTIVIYLIAKYGFACDNLHGESSEGNRRQWDLHQKTGVFLGSSCLASPPHPYTCLNFSGSDDLGPGL